MVNVQFARISVSIKQAVPLNNPFECWMLIICSFPPKFPCDVIGTLLCDRCLRALEFSSLCFHFVCLLCFNFVFYMVKFVAFNLTAALFVDFCCEGLWAFFLSRCNC